MKPVLLPSQGNCTLHQAAWTLYDDRDIICLWRMSSSNVVLKHTKSNQTICQPTVLLHTTTLLTEFAATELRFLQLLAFFLSWKNGSFNHKLWTMIFSLLWTWTSNVSVCTVEPRYVELGYLELLAISNRIGFSLDLPMYFHYGLSQTRSSRTPCYLELFLAPFSTNQPSLSRTLLHSEETLVKISQEVQSRHLVTRCTESCKLYWRVHGNKSKVRLTGLTTANAEEKLLVFVNFRDQTIITPEIWRQPPYLEPCYLELFLDTREIVGFYCIW